MQDASPFRRPVIREELILHEEREGVMEKEGKSERDGERLPHGRPDARLL